MTTKRTIRSVFTIQYHEPTKMWHVLAGSTIIDAWPTRQHLIDVAVDGCLGLWSRGIRCQLRIRSKSGKWQSERTYPDVTPKRKG